MPDATCIVGSGQGKLAVSAALNHFRCLVATYSALVVNEIAHLHSPPSLRSAERFKPSSNELFILLTACSIAPGATSKLHAPVGPSSMNTDWPEEPLYVITSNNPVPPGGTCEGTFEQAPVRNIDEMGVSCRFAN